MCLNIFPGNPTHERNASGKNEALRRGDVFDVPLAATLACSSWAPTGRGQDDHFFARLLDWKLPTPDSSAMEGADRNGPGAPRRGMMALVFQIFRFIPIDPWRKKHRGSRCARGIANHDRNAQGARARANGRRGHPEDLTPS
jgi:hypothetical protein